MIGALVLGVLIGQAAAVGGQPAVKQPWPPAGVSRPGAGVTAPVMVFETKPQYTVEARRAKIQGSVAVEAVVLRDGTVGEVRVIRSLDDKLGLDEEAVKAVKKWRFTPGKANGEPVPVVVEIEMTFTVR